MEKILEAIKALASVCDGAQSRDGQGFNGYDASYARMLLNREWADRDAYNAWRMLRKYRVQLREDFGIDYDALTPPTYATDVVIKPTFNQRWGSLMMPMQGRVSRETFDKYVAIHKELGFKFDGEVKTWYMKKNDLPSYNHDRYIQMMSDIGVYVEDVPEEEVAQQPEQLSVTEVMNDITSKRIRSGYVAIKCINDKFCIAFPFTTELVDLFSNKSGKLSGITEFNLETKMRETYDLETVLEAIEKVKVLLPDWIIATEGVEEAVEKRRQQVEADRKPLPSVAKYLNSEYQMFPYQNEGVRHLVKTDGNSLFGYECGLGKTIMTLAWVAAKGKRALVVAPKIMRRTWVAEAIRFFPGYFSKKVIELRPDFIKKNGMPNLSEVVLASVNYESLEKFLPVIEQAGFDTIIIDESHRMASPKAKITKLLMSMQDSFRHHILLSGTAVKNKKIELFTQTKFIQPGLFSKNELKLGTIGGCWNKLSRTIYIARQKKDVLPDLPEKTTQIIDIEVSGMPSMPSNFGDMGKAKTQAAIAKARSTAEFVQEILDSSESNCLVFSDSREAVEKITALLGEVAILHHGELNIDRREAAKAEFQNDTSPKRVFVTTRQSLAEGATLTRADKVIFNDLPWNPANVTQADSRAHRIGQKKCVNVYWMTVPDNDWDANITDIIRRKYDLSKKINEGKQVTAEEQRWLSQPITLEEVKNLTLKG